MPTRVDPNASILDPSEPVEVTQRELDRTIDVYERITRRHTPGLRGRSPDVDEEGGAQTRAEGEFTTFNFASNDGFWKHDEYLKCVRGVHMVSDTRGLPPGYGTGPTWDRAGE